jgi:hypothetical protein
VGGWPFFGERVGVPIFQPGRKIKLGIREILDHSVSIGVKKA